MVFVLFLQCDVQYYVCTLVAVVYVYVPGWQNLRSIQVWSRLGRVPACRDREELRIV